VLCIVACDIIIYIYIYTCDILHPMCRITFYTLLLPPCPTEPSAPANCPPCAPGPANRPSHSHLPLPNPTGSYSDSHTRSPFGPRAVRRFARAAAATREGGGGAGLRRQPWAGGGALKQYAALQLVPILVPPDPCGDDSRGQRQRGGRAVAARVSGGVRGGSAVKLCTFSTSLPSSSFCWLLTSLSGCRSEARRPRGEAAAARAHWKVRARDSGSRHAGEHRPTT
jgi:hypothetical protein